VHVDEAWCDQHVARVDLLARSARDASDLEDAAAGHGDVGLVWSGTGSINDRPAADDQVGLGHDACALAAAPRKPLRLETRPGAAKCGAMQARMRRSRLLGTGLAGLVASATLRRPAGAAQFEYKLACLDPKESPTAVSLVQMAAAVKAETNGRMQITVFPNGILGSQSGQISQLRLGSIQLLNTNHGSFSTIIPVAQISSIGFAFTQQDQPLELMDGALGEYIRKEFTSKGMYVFSKATQTGFRQMTSSTKPIRTVDDFTGFKMRVLPAPIYVDLFKALGAAPAPIDANEMYTALQTHLVDGQENSLQAIEAYRLPEVQHYLSITNHVWSGSWVVANTDAWNALPADIRAVVERNQAKYALLERRDQVHMNDSLADKLRRQGMVFNNSDVAPMRARLGAYYAKWKSEFGATAWSLLEARVGKLG
jgi:tripartite ATP-independent transporter DctP family solute receptor